MSKEHCEAAGVNSLVIPCAREAELPGCKAFSSGPVAAHLANYDTNMTAIDSCQSFGSGGKDNVGKTSEKNTHLSGVEEINPFC